MNRRRLLMLQQKQEGLPPLVYYSSENGFGSDLSGNGVVLNRVNGTINDDGTLHLNAGSYNYAYIYLKPLGIVKDGKHTIEFQFSFPADIFSVNADSPKWIFTPSVSTATPNGWKYSVVVGASGADAMKVLGDKITAAEKSPGFKKSVIYTLRYTYDAGVINLSINDIVFDFVKTYEPDIALFGKTYHDNRFNYYIPEMNIYSIKIWKGEV